MWFSGPDPIKPAEYFPHSVPAVLLRRGAATSDLEELVLSAEIFLLLAGCCPDTNGTAATSGQGVDPSEHLSPAAIQHYCTNER